MIRRERVLAALFAALEAGCQATVQRNRRTPASAGQQGQDGQPDDPGDCPCLNVVDGGHTVSYENLGLVGYTMRVDVDGAVVADSDALIGPVVNDLYAQVLDAAMADPSLGGECINVREASFDVRIAPVEESARPFADFTVGLEIDFDTPDGDPAG